MAEGLKKRCELDEKYMWNLGDLIPSKEALKALIEDVETGISGYEAYRGKLGDTGEALFSFLSFEEELGEKLDRLYAYAQQKSDEDTSLGENLALVSQVQTLVMKAMEASSFAEPEILAVSDGTMAGFLELEKLSRYKKQLERLLAKKNHMLSGPEERLLAQSMEAVLGGAAVFRLLNNADLKFPTVADETGTQVQVSHGRYGLLLECRDRSVRKAAFQAYFRVYRQFANTIAAVFENSLKGSCFYAKARKYESTRAYYLAENEIPEKVYDNLIATVHSRMDLLHRYVSIRKKALGLDEIHMYDLMVRMVPEFDKTYSYEEAQTLILEALKPLGEEYLEILRQGFHDRWVDVYENQGKRSGGYSNCAYGVHPYVLMSYDDTLDSALTLAHEMGHSLHSWYSNENQPYVYAGYKIFVAEVASTCNEALFLRYLAGRSKSRGEKQYIINQFLERFRGTLYRQTMFAEFELKVHRMAWDGAPLTKDVLCKIYHELNEEYYGKEMMVDSLIDYEWARIPHFYSPFYVYQYATGMAAAIAISSRILSGDQKTLDGYFEFLKGGCSMTPIELLKLCGIHMEEPDVVDEALHVFEQLLNEFEEGA